jgi:hypothetical protein
MTSCSCNAQPSRPLVEYILRMESMDALLGIMAARQPSSTRTYCQQWLAVFQSPDQGPWTPAGKPTLM